MISRVLSWENVLKFPRIRPVAFHLDGQGFSGKRVEWTSVPYTSLRAFSVESAGSWDRDAEVKLYIKAPWLPKISQDPVYQDPVYQDPIYQDPIYLSEPIYQDPMFHPVYQSVYSQSADQFF